eukprot:343781-Prorocentrum_minimum.AAC.1
MSSYYVSVVSLCRRITSASCRYVVVLAARTPHTPSSHPLVAALYTPSSRPPSHDSAFVNDSLLTRC